MSPIPKFIYGKMLILILYANGGYNLYAPANNSIEIADDIAYIQSLNTPIQVS